MDKDLLPRDPEKNSIISVSSFKEKNTAKSNDEYVGGGGKTTKKKRKKNLT